MELKQTVNRGPLIIALCSGALLCLFFLMAVALAKEREPAGKKSKASEGCTCTAIVTWDAPTRNTDGSRLEDLAGYKICYGPRPRKYQNVIKVPVDSADLSCKKVCDQENGKPARTECTYIIRGLDKETRYFAVKAYNRSGRESDFSNEVKK